MRRFATLLLLCACDPETGSEPTPVEGPAGKADGAGAWMIDGTPEAVGVLRMLAEPTTDLEALDHAAALDRRAAENIIAHRNGPDGIYEEGEGDDEPFTAIAQVDAVPWVGASALAKLLAFAFENDFVPGGGQYLGTWEGIDFTVDEAMQLVAFVNTAEPELLDAAMPDARPLAGLLAARPFASVQQIAAVKFVGPATLASLADASDTAPGGEPCQATSECTEGLTCVGIPEFPPFGACRDLTPIEGEDEACAAEIDCGTGLQCSGLTIFDEGFCRPDWMAATIDNGIIASIPGMVMAQPFGISSTVSGLASVPEDIVVTVGLTHSHPESLWLALRDPNGAEAVLWDGPNAGGAAFVPTMNAGWEISRDDEVNGEWTLLVRNVAGQGEGSIEGWSLHVSSRWD